MQPHGCANRHGWKNYCCGCPRRNMVMSGDRKPLVPTTVEKIGLNKNSGCADRGYGKPMRRRSRGCCRIAIWPWCAWSATPPNHNVPPLVMSAINPDSSTNYLNVVASLLKDPTQTLDLLNVGRSMAKHWGAGRGRTFPQRLIIPPLRFLSPPLFLALSAWIWSSALPEHAY